MSFTFQASLLALGLFFGVILCIEIGRRLGKRFQTIDADRSRAGLGAVEAAVFALLGLLIAFTFSGAASRFEDRRDLVSEEANAIGTAWLRLDLLAPEPRAQLQGMFREYLDSRLGMSERIEDVDAALAQFVMSQELQNTIWSNAIAATREDSGGASKLLLPAINDMIDITGTRYMAYFTHPPRIIFVVLFTVALVASMMAGFAMSSGRIRSPLHLVGFAAVLSVSIYVVYDLEYPRLGLITVEGADKVLVDLRESMNRG